jgi:hypothetical protein
MSQLAKQQNIVVSAITDLAFQIREIRTVADVHEADIGSDGAREPVERFEEIEDSLVSLHSAQIGDANAEAGGKALERRWRRILGCRRKICKVDIEFMNPVRGDAERPDLIFQEGAVAGYAHAAADACFVEGRCDSADTGSWG